MSFFREDETRSVFNSYKMVSGFSTILVKGSGVMIFQFYIILKEKNSKFFEYRFKQKQGFCIMHHKFLFQNPINCKIIKNRRKETKCWHVPCPLNSSLFINDTTPMKKIFRVEGTKKVNLIYLKFYITFPIFAYNSLFCSRMWRFLFVNLCAQPFTEEEIIIPSQQATGVYALSAAWSGVKTFAM